MRNDAQFYSQTLSPDLANTVRRIPPPENCTEFVTVWAGDPADTGNAEFPPLTRLYAWRSPGGDTWNIDRMTALSCTGNEEPVVTIERKIVADACFFDALYFCHEHETTDTGILGKIAFPGIGDQTGDTPPHYRDVAQKAHQVFSKTRGTIAPAFNGMILIDGDFTASDIQTARKTLALAGPSPDARLLDIFKAPLHDTALTLAKKKEEAALPAVRSQEIASTHAALQNVMNTGKEMTLALSEQARSSDFQIHLHRNTSAPTELLAIGAGVFGPTGIVVTPLATLAFSLGMGPLAAIWVGAAIGGAGALSFIAAKSRKDFESIFSKKSTGATFRCALANFVAAANTLPADLAQEKKLCAEFAKAADFAFHMEYAAAMAQKFSGHKKREQKLQEYMWLIDHAAQVAQMNPDQTAALRESFTSGCLVRRTYSRAVDHQWVAHEWAPRVIDAKDLPADRQGVDLYGYTEHTTKRLGQRVWTLPDEYLGLKGKLRLTATKFEPA